MGDPALIDPAATGSDLPPTHFVCQSDIVWPELRGPQVPEIPGARLSKLSGGITHSWVLRTYYHLARAGHAISLGADLRPGAINVVGARDFGRSARRPDCFVAVARGDAHPPMLGDFVIEQNGLRAVTRSRCHVAHWPQPGLLPRDAARGQRIERIVYKGRLNNLAAEFRGQAFVDRLAGLGVALGLDAFDGLRGEHDWNDYRAADLVLGVRDLTVYDARKKPASKLVNAWLADVPALLGPEPAYRELRRDPLDYMEVRCPEDVVAAITRLRDAPHLHAAMVENGRARAADFTEERVLAQWVALLTGPLAAAFRAWQGRPAALRWLSHGLALALEKPSKRLDRYRVLRGPRLLSGAVPAEAG